MEAKPGARTEGLRDLLGCFGANLCGHLPEASREPRCSPRATVDPIENMFGQLFPRVPRPLHSNICSVLGSNHLVCLRAGHIDSD